MTFERFIVQCMNLIKMIVKNDAYKPAKNIDGRLCESEEPEGLEDKCCRWVINISDINKEKYN